ncbi:MULTISPECIES: rubrerythrin family protein [Dehalococcoides]|jgi:rubrerythrin|uniref:Rubrerythrin n=1 Tax=Dehalococcoides mccartyi TaxID=61435 RepID=A0A1S7ASH0_9CHLR|nr:MULTISPECIES: rubrerythrin family protein [Dehalococcoides]AGG06047.1 rubrerythrin [Dehalococcoides mccartyi DCMB5]AQX72851.1 rubrerythrin [Dehalococcoides mccartyi]RAL69424.1 Rubrerythrin [Dehalococcoides mccartyi]
MSSSENLKSAFAGESQANRKYLFFADKAEKEGFAHVARLFRAAAEAETVHARNHFNVLKGVGNTAANLEEAVAGESYEFTSMYPSFIKEAETEGNSAALLSFNHANKVEKIHHGLFDEALKEVKSGTRAEDQVYYVCQVCGNTVPGAAPARCPICGAPASSFKLV